MWSIDGAAGPENGEGPLLRLAKEDIEFLSVCRDEVRLDLKELDLGAGGVFF
jgi:hypothetical protein